MVPTFQLPHRFEEATLSESYGRLICFAGVSRNQTLGTQRGQATDQLHLAIWPRLIAAAHVSVAKPIVSRHLATVIAAAHASVASQCRTP